MRSVNPTRQKRERRPTKPKRRWLTLCFSSVIIACGAVANVAPLDGGGTDAGSETSALDVSMPGADAALPVCTTTECGRNGGFCPAQLDQQTLNDACNDFRPFVSTRSCAGLLMITTVIDLETRYYFDAFTRKIVAIQVWAEGSREPACIFDWPGIEECNACWSVVDPCSDAGAYVPVVDDASCPADG